MKFKRPVAGIAGLGLVVGLAASARRTVGQDAAPAPRPRHAASSEEYPKFEDLSEGYEPQSGLFTVYRKKNQLLLEIPEGQLGQVFLCAMSVSGGSTLSGHQTGSFPAAFERIDRKILLVEKEVHWKADERKPLGEVVKRTYADHVRRVVPVVSQHNGNAVVDLVDLLGHGASAFFGSFGASLDSSVIRLAKLKTFPQNIEIALTMPARGDGEMTTLFYSLSALPNPIADEYQPRKADDRIGYFLTAHKDFTNDHDSGDRFVRFVNRWDLRKADPALAVSPPRKPIVFYVEKTVPYRYRKAVADGILEWNKAYEKCGFSGAIVVRQQTDENEFRDFDPEDVRYNFFRWITSERGFAMGPSRVNPYTGQILDADIIFDDSMARFYLRDYDLQVRSGPGKLFSPRLQDLIRQSPERYPFASLEAPGAAAAENPFADASALCSLGEGLAEQVQFAALAGLEFPGFGAAPAAGQAAAGQPAGPAPASQPALKKEFPEDFIYQIIKEVVMHEVGHTLGLRHNFKGSSWRPLAELNVANAPEATSGSVMDYNPLNVRPAKDVPQGKYITQTLGPYDYWAIEYGYKDGAQEGDLRAIASRGEESGLAYATDEDATGPDPLVNRFDFGADPLEFSAQRMAIAQQLWSNLLERVVDKGEGYQDARRAFDLVLGDYARSGIFAARFVGGEYVHRDHKGDPGERDPIVVVEAKKQREALKLICDRVLSDAAFKFPPELLRKLAAGRWSHWGSDDTNHDVSYPIYDRLLGVQMWSIFQLTNPETLDRLVADEAKVGENDEAFTVAELFETLDRSVFAELETIGKAEAPASFTERRPFISTIRRNLQRAYAKTLIDISVERDGPTPAVARTLVWHRLKALKARIDETVAASAKGVKLDAYSAAHLDETSTRIGKALDASFLLGH